MALLIEMVVDLGMNVLSVKRCDGAHSEKYTIGSFVEKGRSDRTRDEAKNGGDVLRCIIDDGGPNGEVIIHIDDQELSLTEFGRLLRVHAGWGMRIAFVPEEFVTEKSDRRGAQASEAQALTQSKTLGT